MTCTSRFRGASLALAVVFAAASAAAQTVPLDRADLIVAFKNLQNAAAEVLSDRDRLRAEVASLEARLETAMGWLKSAQQPK